MELEFEKKFKKGQILDASFNEFIHTCLSDVCKLQQDGPFPHDIIVKFKKDVIVKVSFTFIQ